MRAALALLLALLAIGLVTTGCGDDDEESGADTGPPAGQTQEQTREQEAPAREREGTDTRDAPTGTEEAVETAIENCKTGVEAQPQLSDDVKSDLEEICEQAASGDEDAVREAAKDVCVKIVEETVPPGPAREQAETACDQAIQTR